MQIQDFIGDYEENFSTGGVETIEEKHARLRSQSTLNRALANAKKECDEERKRLMQRRSSPLEIPQRMPLLFAEWRFAR